MCRPRPRARIETDSREKALAPRRGSRRGMRSLEGRQPPVMPGSGYRLWRPGPPSPASRGFWSGFSFSLPDIRPQRPRGLDSVFGFGFGVPQAPTAPPPVTRKCSGGLRFSSSFRVPPNSSKPSIYRFPGAARRKARGQGVSPGEEGPRQC